MSTFNGIVKEFPNIRIDHFRIHPNFPPPSVCFLSHVHSDHLQGLESLRMPFVYCSAATKALLLRMEKYPHRVNFAKGILESRKQHYRHLRLVLRALPLNAATEIEIGPKSRIRVVLIDANHCPGAVMFLIEGDGRAILYTGDIRSEPWWVNSIVQNPFILPYTCGQKVLDCIYLDTTFASPDDMYKNFPSKSDGIKELLEKVGKCSSDSIFYLRAWTLGYEEVWIALSNHLQSPVHVDDYQLRLFRSLVENGRSVDGATCCSSLIGFPVGHHTQPGILTFDTKVKIHSCEPGTICYEETSKLKNLVRISPIISRLGDGTEILELGAGGGGGDLYQIPLLEVDESATIEAFQLLCSELIQDDDVLSQVQRATSAAQKSGKLKISLQGLGLDQDTEMTLKEFVKLMTRHRSWTKKGMLEIDFDQSLRKRQTIHFPYSRHSSHSELRYLLSVFRPRDICPCTVEIETWSEDFSMQALFGDLCSEHIFYYDQESRSNVRKGIALQNSDAQVHSNNHETQNQTTQASSYQTQHFESAMDNPNILEPIGSGGHEIPSIDLEKDMSISDIRKRFHSANKDGDQIIPQSMSSENRTALYSELGDSQISVAMSAFDSQSQQEHIVEENTKISKAAKEEILAANSRKRSRSEARIEAYKAAKLCLTEGDPGEWNELSLRSLGYSRHTEEELEL